MSGGPIAALFSTDSVAIDSQYRYYQLLHQKASFNRNVSTDGARCSVDTPTPGIRAAIRLGNSPDGPFSTGSRARTLTARTRFPVAKRPGRYVVVWVTSLPPESAGEVSEVRLRAR